MNRIPPATNEQNTPKTNEQTQPMNRIPPATNEQNTPKTNEQNTPTTNDQNTPTTNDQNTPATNDQNTPATNEQNTPATNEQNTPTTNEQNTPATNDQNTPATNDQNTPATNEQNTPTTNEQNTPATNDQNTPATNDQNTPATNEQNTPATNEQNTPQPMTRIPLQPMTRIPPQPMQIKQDEQKVIEFFGSTLSVVGKHNFTCVVLFCAELRLSMHEPGFEEAEEEAGLAASLTATAGDHVMAGVPLIEGVEESQWRAFPDMMDLKDFMRQAGEVTFADAHRPKLNEGVVEFASSSDVRNALDKLSGKEINGRKIKLTEAIRRR
ncbi:UNVERIFIED_CONTAM: hypothetical protein FKN15_071671 [Acipenser sinensis]